MWVLASLKILVRAIVFVQFGHSWTISKDSSLRPLLRLLFSHQLLYHFNDDLLTKAVLLEDLGLDFGFSHQHPNPHALVLIIFNERIDVLRHLPEQSHSWR